MEIVEEPQNDPKKREKVQPNEIKSECSRPQSDPKSGSVSIDAEDLSKVDEPQINPKKSGDIMHSLLEMRPKNGAGNKCYVNNKGASDKMECVESRFELLALDGREEEAMIEEEKGERGIDREWVRERRVIVTVECNLAKKDDEIEVLRGLDGINDLPRSELYDDDSFEEEGSVVLSEGDIEMPTLEDLVVEDTLSEGDISLDGEEDEILPSQLREFLFEDEEVIMVEGGWRRSGLPDDENDVWEYVNHEAIEAGEQPVLGVGVFDRVI